MILLIESVTPLRPPTKTGQAKNHKQYIVDKEDYKVRQIMFLKFINKLEFSPKDEEEENEKQETLVDQTPIPIFVLLPKFSSSSDSQWTCPANRHSQLILCPHPQYQSNGHEQESSPAQGSFHRGLWNQIEFLVPSSCSLTDLSID